MGLPYPGGAALDRLAREGDPARYVLPRAGVAGAPYDFSFSGLKTAAVNLLHNAQQKEETVHEADLYAVSRADAIAPRASWRRVRAEEKRSSPRAASPQTRFCAPRSSRAAREGLRLLRRRCGCAATTAR